MRKAFALGQPPHKYHARPIVWRGEHFDSTGEFTRYRELVILEQNGYIRQLRRQVDYILHVSGLGGPVPIGSWRADFTYEERVQDALLMTWPLIVEDFKGVVTPLYAWKKHHVEAEYGFRIRETGRHG